MFGLITFVLLVAGLASALTGQAGVSRLLFAMGRDGVISRSIFAYIHLGYRLQLAPSIYFPTRRLPARSRSVFRSPWSC